MKTEAEIREYLVNCEYQALTSLAANKWERFGYWASQSTHMRRILGLTSTPSPFRDFADLARCKLNE